MSTDISLKEIERKAYRSTFQDGILEISMGLLLLGFGLAPVLENIGIPRPLNILLVVVIPLLTLRYGKKWVTVPRIGFVKFGPQRIVRKKRLRVFAIILFVITVVQLILTLTGAFPPDWMTGMGQYSVPIIISLFAILVFAAFAYFRDIPRLFIIGFLFGFAIMFSEYLYFNLKSPLDGLIGCGVPAIIILVLGLTQLIRFLRKYPLSDAAEVTDDRQ
jgi:hypothetical protein